MTAFSLSSVFHTKSLRTPQIAMNKLFLEYQSRKTLWSNLLVSILSDITNTTTRPERESCLAPKRFSGVKNYFVFYETIFSRITLCTFGSRADSDSFNIPTVIQQPSLRLNSPDRFRSLLFSNELREKFQALNTG